MIVNAVVLGFLGLCLGSFVNAVVWRVRQQSLVNSRQSSYKKAKNQSSKKLSAISYQPSAQDLSILKGRSMCVDCGHTLAAKDLIPVFSWLYLKGRCRYCQKPISWQYPLVEVIMASIFVKFYLLWPVDLANGQWLLLATWLASSVGLMALLIYDYKWMLLPNRILYPTFFVALAGRLGYILFFSKDITGSSWSLALSLLAASGIFWLLFYVSKGRWIGYGDVRLGLITGTLLATPALSLLMIFVAAVLGSLFAAPALLTGRKQLVSKLPFGPFLIVSTAFCLIYGQQIINWYTRLFRT